MGSTVVKSKEDVLECIAKREAFKLHATLTALELAGHDIPQDGIKLITKCLEKDEILVLLDLAGSAKNQESIEMLVGLFLANRTITSFNLSDCLIGLAGITTFAPCLENHREKKILTGSTLTVLKLAGNNLGDEGTVVLFKALTHNQFIHTLDVSNNDITDGATPWIAACFKKNNVLRSLNLQNNKIGDQGGKSLSEGLRHNIGLHELELFGNAIGLFTETWNEIQRTINMNIKFIMLQDGITSGVKQQMDQTELKWEERYTAFEATNTKKREEWEKETLKKQEEWEKKISKMLEEFKKDLKQKEERIEELEAGNKKLEKRVKELEKASEKASDKIDGLQKSQKKTDSEVGDLSSKQSELHRKHIMLEKTVAIIPGGNPS